MIIVKLNEPNFEYDIHSLVKAFYPREDVAVSAEEKQVDGPVVFRIIIEYLHDQHDASRGDPGSISFAFLQADGAQEKPQEEQRNVRNLADGRVAQQEAASGKAGSQAVQKTAMRGEDGRRTLQVREMYGKAVLTGSVQVDHANRKETKNRLKQRLYQLLEEFSGKTLPWGTLTGIRPTKIPMAMLEEGRDQTAIRDYMKSTYFASDAKIDLAIEVAERERGILDTIDYENGYSMYIGIPFCPTTCAYCSFTSYPLTRWKDRVDEYLDCIEKELDFTTSAVDTKHLDTIYIGGGTPTTLLPAQMDRLLSMIEQKADLSSLREITVEAGRPDSITRDRLQVMKDHGVTRISINPQTMKQATLDLIGRCHTVEQTKEAFALARELGFDDINMDLIVGLPEETLDDVRATMGEMQKMRPDNLTVHSLAIKRAARLRIEREQYRGLHITNTWETIGLAADCCRSMGLRPYYLYRQKNMAGNFENVGYARAGCEGLYNILIMEEKQTIMALGAGASTKFVLPNTPEKRAQTGAAARIERVENVKDITNYLERIDEMIERKRNKMEELGWH